MNFKKETGFRYKVKNQNGFNNALYDYYDTTDTESKQDIRRRVANYPIKYPCKIVIIDDKLERAKIYIDVEYYNWFLTKWNKWFF